MNAPEPKNILVLVGHADAPGPQENITISMPISITVPFVGESVPTGSLADLLDKEDYTEATKVLSVWAMQVGIKTLRPFEEIFANWRAARASQTAPAE